MDSKWNAAQGRAGASSSSGVGPNSNAKVDWRLQLHPDARQRIVNRLMDTLKRHVPVSVPKGLNEFQTAVHFEEKIHSAAISQSDYFRRLSLFLSSMEKKALPEDPNPAILMDSATQTGHPEDWREEIYQKLKYLKDTYLADLGEIHQKLSSKLSQLDSMMPPNVGGEQIENMKQFKVLLERMMKMLSLGKDNLPVGLKDMLPFYEKRILSILQNSEKEHQQHYQAVIHGLSIILL